MADTEVAAYCIQTGLGGLDPVVFESVCRDATGVWIQILSMSVFIVLGCIRAGVKSVSRRRLRIRNCIR